jgi:hypothetical protein
VKSYSLVCGLQGRSLRTMAEPIAYQRLHLPSFINWNVLGACLQKAYLKRESSVRVGSIEGAGCVRILKSENPG